MKNQNAIVNALGGINEQEPQQASDLSELINWKTDPLTIGWTNHLGFEKYFTYKTNWNPFASMKKVDSLFYFQRHQGAQDSILFEAGGSLYHLFEHGTPGKKELVSDRNIPKVTESRTQYLALGRFLIFVNGVDKPSKYLGWPVTQSTYFTPAIYPLGFQRIPGTPKSWSVYNKPQDNQKVATNSISVFFKTDQAMGVGIKEDGKENKYRYRVSFINNAGAESPLSAPSEAIVWKSIDTTSASPTGAGSVYTFALALEIPLGENDVVARRIYRTKNYSSDGGANANNYFFVADVPNNFETLFIDSIADIGLGSSAPSDTESIVFPAMTGQYMGLYKDCLFIDGGQDNNTTIYFSNPSRPDQYSALDFISVGNRSGGGITGFYGYFGYMLVFRENSIDVVQGDYPNFTATPFEQHIGTRATDTITMVPGLGVVFLSKDGIYAVGANIEYSDTTSTKKISSQIQYLMSRINVACLPQATACYSEKHREWHCYFAIDGSSINNVGVVYHTDKGVWSIREDFPVGPLIKNDDADLIFGYNKSASTADDPAGLFVISARRAKGEKITEGSMIDEDPPTSTIASAWLDMGDPGLKKKVHSVYLFIRTGGDNTITMETLRDFNYNNSNTTLGVKLQKADFADQNVYDLVKLDDSKYWEEPISTPIRFDVHDGSCSWFQWKVSTTTDLTIVGYAIDYTVSGTRIIAGKKLS